MPTLAFDETKVTAGIDLDRNGCQKPTGWIRANDCFLVLDTAAKLEAELIAQGYEVRRDDNGIYASKGQQYLSFTSEAMTFQNGNEWASLALGKNGPVISGSHLGVDVLELHVDISGANTVLRGHLSGDGDDLGERVSETFQVDQVISINGQAIDPLGSGTYGLNADDYLSYGLSFDNLVGGTVPQSGTDLITGLDPAAQAANGWTAPQITLTDLGDGLSQRSIELGSGVTLSSVRDDDRRIVGTITDTPDGAGGLDRVIETLVGSRWDGDREVIIQQHINADQLALDADNDGNAIDPGDASTTGITIRGDAALDAALLAQALDDRYQSPQDIIMARNSAQLVQLVDASNANTPTWMLGGNGYWYNDPNVQQLGGALTDVQALITALKSGKPLAIATPIFSLAASFSRNADITSISQGLGTLSSLSSLSNFTDALERGDELAAISSGASFVNSVYSEFFKSAIETQLLERAGIDLAANVTAAQYREAVDAALVQVTDLGALGDKAAASLAQTAQVFRNLADALPYLNLINAVANGDAAGTAVAIAVIAGVPYIGWIYAAYSIITTLFSDPPDVHGTALAGSAQDGQHAQASIIDNSEGGGNTAGSVLSNLIAGLESTFADTTALGLIAQRLPSLYFKGYSGGGYYSLTFHDAQTGQGYVRNYTSEGAFMGEGQAGYTTDFADSEDFFKNISQQFVEAAYQGGAVAPQWMVKTVDAQAARGDALAGLTTEQRAAALSLNANSRSERYEKHSFLRNQIGRYKAKRF